MSAEGEIFVLDRGRGRTSVIDARTGQPVVSFPLAVGSGYGILPGYGEARVLIVPEQGLDTTLWVSVSEGGRKLGSKPMPETISRACGHPMGCEFFTTVTGSRGSAIAFRWSSTLVFLEPDGSVRAIVDGVETIPFPEVKTYRNVGPFRSTVTRVDPQAPTAVLDITADSSHLFVSFAGLSEDKRRLVDVYSVMDGSYLGSYLFPEEVSELAILSDGRLATRDVEYYPTVHFWEMHW